MKQFILMMIVAGFFFACGGSTGGGQEKASSETTPASNETATTSTSEGYTLPPYPQEKVKVLFDSCDYIDVIFYYESFSINQHNKKDIIGMLNNVSSNPPASINPDCQPIGRIFFQIQGRNAAEADIFFQDQCLYFLFYEDKKYAYANNFTQSGVNFFSNIFAQVKVKKEQVQQQGQ